MREREPKKERSGEIPFDSLARLWSSIPSAGDFPVGLGNVQREVAYSLQQHGLKLPPHHRVQRVRAGDRGQEVIAFERPLAGYVRPAEALFSGMFDERITPVIFDPGIGMLDMPNPALAEPLLTSLHAIDAFAHLRQEAESFHVPQLQEREQQATHAAEMYQKAKERDSLQVLLEQQFLVNGFFGNFIGAQTESLLQSSIENQGHIWNVPLAIQDEVREQQATGYLDAYTQDFTSGVLIQARGGTMPAQFAVWDPSFAEDRSIQSWFYKEGAAFLSSQAHGATVTLYPHRSMSTETLFTLSQQLTHGDYPSRVHIATERMPDSHLFSVGPVTLDVSVGDEHTLTKQGIRKSLLWLPKDKSFSFARR